MIRMIERKEDILTGNTDLEYLHTFRHLPINFGVTEQDESKDEFADAKWMISKKSGMIQLGELIPDEVLYAESHHAGNAKIWQEHYEKFAKFINDNAVGESVLEIGGGNGNLNRKYYAKYGTIVEWLIVEPSNIEPLDGVNASYIRGFYDAQFELPIQMAKCDNIVHSHLMEHILNLDEFMKKNMEILEEGGMMLFSIPNLREELKRKYSNALMFEHTYFLAEEYINFLMEKYCFDIVKMEYFRDEHSIFIAARKGIDIVKVDETQFEGYYERNKCLFEEYINYYESLVKRLNSMIRDKNNESRIFLFGAHVFSQFLIANGLDVSKIECILDNDKLKQGKRLYGTSFSVCSPKILQDIDKPIVILKCGAYDEEIMEDIVNNINSGTIFFR